MRIPRFRVRTLGIAVAVIAFAFASGLEAQRLWRASQFYQAKAQWAGYWEWRHQWEATSADKKALNVVSALKAGPVKLSPKELQSIAEPLIRDLSGERDRHAAAADHFNRLKQKYNRAARYPWRSVEPDSSAP
jgi:hypothetical protein